MFVFDWVSAATRHDGLTSMTDAVASPFVSSLAALAVRYGVCDEPNKELCEAAFMQACMARHTVVEGGEIIIDLAAFVDGGKFYLAALRKTVEVACVAEGLVLKDRGDAPFVVNVKFVGADVLLSSRDFSREKGTGGHFLNAVTRYVEAQCLRTSAVLSKSLGTCDAYKKDETQILREIGRVRDEVGRSISAEVPLELQAEIKKMWDGCLEDVMGYGLFMMIDVKCEEIIAKVTAPVVPQKMYEQQAVRHQFSLQGVQCSIVVMLNEHGAPCEFLLSSGQRDSVVDGLLGVIGQLMTAMVQKGATIQEVTTVFQGGCFLPFGETASHPSVPFASSIMDYVAKWLHVRFVSHSQRH